MSERFPSDGELAALSGVTDTDSGLPHMTIGQINWYTHRLKMEDWLDRVLAATASALRVYKDGDLTFGVRPGGAGDGGTAYAYDGAAANALTDDATNYIYLTAGDLTAGNTVTVNTTGFPAQSATPHIALAEIVTASATYACGDITDRRSTSAMTLQSAMTAANANTLVGAGNADALHIHNLGGLDGDVQRSMPMLNLTPHDDEDGTGTVAIQVANPYSGDPIAGRYRVRVWIGTAGYGAPVAQTDFSVTTGTQLRQITADADYEVITDATGLVLMNVVAADGAYYVMAEVDGAIYETIVYITGN